MYKLVHMPLDSSARGRCGKKIRPKGLVIHWTANIGIGSDADNTRNYFNNSGAVVSTHYIVDDHQVIQCLPEDEMAYHVGANKYSLKAVQKLSSYPNDCTIGIEVCVNHDGNFKNTLENTIALAADICRRHGWNKNNLWRHYDVTGKDCPKFFVDYNTAKAYGFISPDAGWEQFKTDVETAIWEGARSTVPDWKEKIMADAKAEGLISEDHNPDDAATKWFVLAVALNVLKKLRG